MFMLLINFANLLLAALLVGALFGVRLFLNPSGLSASSYLVVQQQAIRTMNTVMPVLGAITISVTITAAVLSRTDRRSLWLLMAAAIGFIASGLITKFLNQPINSLVLTWRPDAPPSDWMKLRDEWWRWHAFRLLSGIIGLTLVIAAALGRNCKY